MTHEISILKSHLKARIAPPRRFGFGFRSIFGSWVLVLGISLAGCINKPSHPEMKGLATDLPKALARSDFWYDQPGTTAVEDLSFDRLWQAANDALRVRFFSVDRTDYRAGVLTSKPEASAQFFEPWRRDTPTAYDVAESSLATVRRTVRFEITRTERGTYQLVPKVLVERYNIAEGRISAGAIMAGQAIGGPRSGSVESDQGIDLPQQYWYALGRDSKLEAILGKAVESRLK